MTESELSEIDLGVEVALALRRLSEEVAHCRHLVRQARDQFIAAEIAAERAEREAA
jgi:hypothetical protein